MKAIIIDDEPMPAKHLKKLAEQHCFEISSIRIENSPIKALEILKEEYFDIIFLDVEMPELNGFELLQEANLSSRSKVIFTTAYSQYAIKAFETDAVSYLLKMISKDELILAVRRVLKSRLKQRSSPDYKVVSVYYNDEYNLLNENEIIRLEAKKGYTFFITESKKILSSKGIGFYEKKLDNISFYRCHNSHIVNINKIKKISKGKSGYIELSNKDVVPIATSKREALNEIFQF